MELGLALAGGTTWAVGALMAAHAARIPHRLEVQGRSVVVRSLLRTRRFELPPDARLDWEVQQRPKGRFVRVFFGTQALLPFVPAGDEARYGTFVRAANASGSATLVVPKAFVWTLALVPFVLGAVLFAAAFRG